MNAKQAKYPQLRFKGFTNPWEKRKLGEIAKVQGGGTPSSSNSEYWDGGINWFTPTEVSNSGYLSESNRKISELGLAKSSAKVLPVGTVLMTSRAGVGDMGILTQEAATNQGFQSLIPDEGVPSYFLYSMQQSISRQANRLASGSTFTEISGKQVAKIPEWIPTSHEERRKVGDFFANLDNLIAVNQRKLAKLKELKQGYLQKMFPKNGSKFPQLRFSGFADAWEQRKLTEIVNRVNKSSNSDVLPKVEFEDIVSGEGRLNKDISSKFDSRKGTLFEPENILYGKLRPYLKNWLFPEFEGVALGDFWVFEATDVSVPSFDYYLIQSDNYQKVANDTSGTKMPRSDWKSISSTDFAIPSKDEQKQIGAFFKQLDDTITLHQRKLEKLQELKKGYLQKMFC